MTHMEKPNSTYANLSGYFDVYKESQEKNKDPLRDDFTSLVKKVMGTAQGKQLLEMLEKGYLDAAVSPIGCPEGWAFYREGQNNMVRLLRSIVKGENT